LLLHWFYAIIFYHSIVCVCVEIATMPTKIFVGRLVDGISSDDIRTLFRKFGTVTECDVVSNFGFVVSIRHARIAYKMVSDFCILCHEKFWAEGYPEN